MENPDTDLIVERFEQVAVAPADGLLDIPRGFPLERFGPSPESIKEVVRASVAEQEGLDAWNR